MGVHCTVFWTLLHQSVWTVECKGWCLCSTSLVEAAPQGHSLAQLYCCPKLNTAHSTLCITHCTLDIVMLITHYILHYSLPYGGAQCVHRCSPSTTSGTDVHYRTAYLVIYQRCKNMRPCGQWSCKIGVSCVKFIQNVTQFL